MKKTLVVLTLLLAGIVSHAQNDSSMRIELGLNTAPLFVKDNYYGTSISSRFHFKDIVNLRFQVGYNGFSTGGDASAKTTNAFFSNGTIDSTISYDPAVNWDAFVLLGVGAQKKIAPKFHWVYGMDFGLGRSEHVNTTILDVKQAFQPNNVTFFHTEIKDKVYTRSFAIVPFTGVSYRFNDRISLSYEGSLQVIVEDNEETTGFIQEQSNSFNPNVFRQENTKTQEVRNIITKLNPMSGMHILITL